MALIPSADRWLYTGAGLGLIAFLINAMAHSFIGGFEVMYFAWFLAALLVASSPEARAGNDIALDGVEKSRHTDSKRKRPFAVCVAAILFLVFLGSHLWNSTRALSLGARAERFDLLPEFGLGAWEQGAGGREFRWSGKRAGVPLDVAAVRAGSIILPVQAAHPDIASRPVRLTVDLVRDGYRRLDRMAALELRDNDWHDLKLDLGRVRGPSGDAARPSGAKKAMLLVRVDRTWSPRRALGVSDQRILGIALGRIR